MTAEASRHARRHKAGTRVVIGLGSNRPHGRHGRPEAVLRAAARALADAGIAGLRLSRIRATDPLGPSQRRFANAAALGLFDGDAVALLALLKRIERDFGRRGGRRWGPRVLDLDLLAFGETVIAAPGLRVPHPGLPHRAFALAPLSELWPRWRHPILNLPARALAARLGRPRPIDRPHPAP